MRRKLNQTMWRNLLQFTKAASAKIIVGLAVPKWIGCKWDQGTDRSNCTLWNATNAKQLLNWTVAHGYSDLIYAFELVMRWMGYTPAKVRPGIFKSCNI